MIALFSSLRALVWLKRTALALERIATVLEEGALVSEAKSTRGVSLRALYTDRSSVEGAVFMQDPAEYARYEQLEKALESEGGRRVGIDEDLDEEDR